jgi:hypothetical protein
VNPAFVKHFARRWRDVGALRHRANCPELQHCRAGAFSVTCIFTARLMHPGAFAELIEKSHACNIPLK